MKDIAIYGAGGFGREIACLIAEINRVNPTWNLIGFFDDGLNPGDSNEYGKILGGIDDLNAYPNPISIAFGIGSPKFVSLIRSKISNSNVSFPNLFDPSVHWLDKKNVDLGEGNIMCAQGFISCNVKLGNFNIINNGVSLGHDCIIGDFNSIMPGAHISGGVKIGNRNFLGVNSVILQYHEIVDDITVGAGSVVMRKIKKPGTYIGVPAQKLQI